MTFASSAFRVLPSVGTWLGKCSTMPPIVQDATESAGSFTIAEPSDWQRRPSVGTWVVRRQAKLLEKHGSEFATTWHLQPSVGTWVPTAAPSIAKLPADESSPEIRKDAESVAASWQLRPSVGTWVGIASLRNDIDDASGDVYSIAKESITWSTRPSVGTWVGKTCSPHGDDELGLNF